MTDNETKTTHAFEATLPGGDWIIVRATDIKAAYFAVKREAKVAPVAIGRIEGSAL